MDEQQEDVTPAESEQLSFTAPPAIPPAALAVERPRSAAQSMTDRQAEAARTHAAAAEEGHAIALELVEDAMKAIKARPQLDNTRMALSCLAEAHRWLSGT